MVEPICRPTSARVCDIVLLAGRSQPDGKIAAAHGEAERELKADQGQKVAHHQRIDFTDDIDVIYSAGSM